MAVVCRGCGWSASPTSLSAYPLCEGCRELELVRNDLEVRRMGKKVHRTGVTAAVAWFWLWRVWLVSMAVLWVVAIVLGSG